MLGVATGIGLGWPRSAVRYTANPNVAVSEPCRTSGMVLSMVSATEAEDEMATEALAEVVKPSEPFRVAVSDSEPLVMRG